VPEPPPQGLAADRNDGTFGVMEPKVKAGIWVQMALRMSDMAGRSGAILRKGDADSGGVLCVLRGRDGLVVLTQIVDAEGRRAWMRGTGPAPVEQEKADAYVERQVKRDPDVWVIELDAPDLQPPFEARIV
jgi:hypothetical protein